MSIIIKDADTFETHVVDIEPFIKHIEKIYTRYCCERNPEIEGDAPNEGYMFFLDDIHLTNRNINIISDGDTITKELIYHSAKRNYCVDDTCHGEFLTNPCDEYCKRDLTFIGENDACKKYSDGNGGVLMFHHYPKSMKFNWSSTDIPSDKNFLYPIYVEEDELCTNCGKIVNDPWYAMDYFGLECECN